MKCLPKILKRSSVAVFLLSPFFLTFVFLVYAESSVATYEGLLHAIRETQRASQASIEQAVDQAKVRESWETGKLIDEHILLHKDRADYGKQILDKLAGDLGTSQTELSFMLQFARAYPIYSPANKLSWSHYRELLSLNDAKEREQLAEKAEKQHWNRDQLREEVRKRKPALLSQNTVTGDPQIEEMKPGKVGVYRVLEIAGEKYYDLGFSTYFKINGKSLDQNPPESDLYTYEAQVTQVFDGDTFHAYVNLGFGIVLEQRLRLRALDAPEIISAEGKQAKRVLEKALLRDKRKILLKVSRSDDQYGRYLADVWVKDKNINQSLLASELFTVRENA